MNSTSCPRFSQSVQSNTQDFFWVSLSSYPEGGTWLGPVTIAVPSCLREVPAVETRTNGLSPIQSRHSSCSRNCTWVTLLRANIKNYLIFLCGLYFRLFVKSDHELQSCNVEIHYITYITHYIIILLNYVPVKS